jgi:hypothetical protein
MLDNLYENIGGKIKSWAKWIFVVEAIAAIIAGLVMMFGDSGDDIMILWGLIILVFGPCVALVSTWLLYAFGELVEAVCDNKNTTEQIRRKMSTGVTIAVMSNTEKKATEAESISTSGAGAHRWICDRCKKLRTQNPCEFCGG